MLVASSLFILCWFMIFTAGRFIRYYRILQEYKSSTTAVVTNAVQHIPVNREEKKQKLIDVTMEYTINDEVGRSEITVPAARAEEYKLGTSVPISYKVSPNGTIHIASELSGVKKIAISHLIVFVVELAAFVAIWFIL